MPSGTSVAQASLRWNACDMELQALKAIQAAELTHEQRVRMQDLDNLKDDLLTQAGRCHPMLARAAMLSAMGHTEVIGFDTVGELDDDHIAEADTDDEKDEEQE